MISAAMNTNMIEAASSDQLKVSIAARVIECLLAFLKGNESLLASIAQWLIERK